MRVLRDNVLVKPCPKETERGGIHIPEVIDSERYDETIVEVIIAGEKCLTGIKAGDKCYFAPLKGQKLKYKGEDHIMCQEVELYGILLS